MEYGLRELAGSTGDGETRGSIGERGFADKLFRAEADVFAGGGDMKGAKKLAAYGGMGVGEVVRGTKMAVGLSITGGTHVICG
ncbi:MAG: hypothetical protein ITG04_09430 [Proteiniphilum sp.]|nr:hypothetical protein [Proteiniphilum sp.]